MIQYVQAGQPIRESLLNALIENANSPFKPETKTGAENVSFFRNGNITLKAAAKNNFETPYMPCFINVTRDEELNVHAEAYPMNEETLEDWDGCAPLAGVIQGAAQEGDVMTCVIEGVTKFYRNVGQSSHGWLHTDTTESPYVNNSCPVPGGWFMPYGKHSNIIFVKQEPLVLSSVIRHDNVLSLNLPGHSNDKIKQVLWTSDYLIDAIAETVKNIDAQFKRIDGELDDLPDSYHFRKSKNYKIIGSKLYPTVVVMGIVPEDVRVNVLAGLRWMRGKIQYET